MTETTGALVIGGNLNGLSIARSLGRHGVPVWVTTPADVKLASCSRYTLRTLPWPGGECEAQVAYLLELAERYQLDHWVLFPNWIKHELKVTLYKSFASAPSLTAVWPSTFLCEGLPMPRLRVRTVCR